MLQFNNGNAKDGKITNDEDANSIIVKQNDIN